MFTFLHEILQLVYYNWVYVTDILTALESHYISNRSFIMLVPLPPICYFSANICILSLSLRSNMYHIEFFPKHEFIIWYQLSVWTLFYVLFILLINLQSNVVFVILLHYCQTSAGCPAMSPHKIPWLFPDISLTILWFSLTMRHIIGISLLP